MVCAWHSIRCWEKKLAFEDQKYTLEKVSVTEGINVKTFQDQRMVKMANTLEYFHLHTPITQNKKLGYLGNYNLIKAYSQ